MFSTKPKVRADCEMQADCLKPCAWAPSYRPLNFTGVVGELLQCIKNQEPEAREPVLT